MTTADPNNSGSIEKRTEWWEWLLALIGTPLVGIILLFALVASFPLELIYRRRQRREEQQLQPRLAALGRFMSWNDVEAKLRVGEGTLIVEHCSPKGPVRDWWTEDDLIAPSPVPLPSSLQCGQEQGQLQSTHDYAQACASRYVDIQSGTAKLTEVPIPSGERLDPRKYVTVNLGGGLMTAIILVRGRMLLGKYPLGKVVTLLMWGDQPLLFIGDAESVFLPPTEPRAAS